MATQDNLTQAELLRGKIDEANMPKEAEKETQKEIVTIVNSDATTGFAGFSPEGFHNEYEGDLNKIKHNSIYRVTDYRSSNLPYEGNTQGFLHTMCLEELSAVQVFFATMQGQEIKYRVLTGETWSEWRGLYENALRGSGYTAINFDDENIDGVYYVRAKASSGERPCDEDGVLKITGLTAKSYEYHTRSSNRFFVRTYDTMSFSSWREL